jgi:hypothetical protein
MNQSSNNNNSFSMNNIGQNNEMSNDLKLLLSNPNLKNLLSQFTNK